jgi:hypothetical protein
MSIQRTLALAALVVTAAACASSSSFTSTWKNPDAAPVSLTGKKILAIVQIRDEARRRQAEDELAAEITRLGGQGIPSYSLFPSNSGQQDEAVRSRSSSKNPAFSPRDIAGAARARIDGHAPQDLPVSVASGVLP